MQFCNSFQLGQPWEIPQKGTFSLKCHSKLHLLVVRAMNSQKILGIYTWVSKAHLTYFPSFSWETVELINITHQPTVASFENMVILPGLWRFIMTWHHFMKEERTLPFTLPPPHSALLRHNTPQGGWRGEAGNTQKESAQAAWKHLSWYNITHPRCSYPTPTPHAIPYTWY